MTTPNTSQQTPDILLTSSVDSNPTENDPVRSWLFAYEGRLGRLSYLAGILLLGIIALVALYFCDQLFGMLLGSIVVAFAGLTFYIILTKRRLHDLDISGWVMVFPLGACFASNLLQLLGVNIEPLIASMIIFVFSLALFLIPGTDCVNSYGPIRYTSILEKLIGWISLLLIIAGHTYGLYKHGNFF